MTVRLNKKKPTHSEPANGLLPGEDADIVKEAENVIPDASTWLDTPNVKDFILCAPRAITQSRTFASWRSTQDKI
jgi:hypothetical protein